MHTLAGTGWRYCLNKGIGSYLSKRRLSEDKVIPPSAPRPPPRVSSIGFALKSLPERARVPGKIGSIARNFRSISTRLETYHVLSLLFVSGRGLFFSRRREEKEKEEAGEQPARGEKSWTASKRAGWNGECRFLGRERMAGAIKHAERRPITPACQAYDLRVAEVEKDANDARRPAIKQRGLDSLSRVGSHIPPHPFNPRPLVRLSFRFARLAAILWHRFSRRVEWTRRFMESLPGSHLHKPLTLHSRASLHHNNRIGAEK